MYLAHFAIMCAVFYFIYSLFHSFVCLAFVGSRNACLCQSSIAMTVFGVGGFTVMVPNVLGCKDRYFASISNACGVKIAQKKWGRPHSTFFSQYPIQGCVC